MKANKISILLISLLFISCSNTPKVVKPIDVNNIVVWKKTIQEFIEYRGSLYKPSKQYSDDVEYIVGEWTENGTYIKAIDYFTKNEIWRESFQVDSITNLVFDQKRVFFGTSLGLYFALDKKTGKTLWSFKAPQAIYDFNNIHKKTVIFRDIDFKLYSLDTEEGNLLWTFDLSSLFSSIELDSGPTYSSGIIFFSLNQGILLGVDAENGKEKWISEYPYQKGDSFFIHEDLIIALGKGKDDRVTLQTFILKTGKKSWAQKILTNKNDKYLLNLTFIQNHTVLNFKNTILISFKNKSGAQVYRTDLNSFQFGQSMDKKIWLQDKNEVFFLCKGTGSLSYALCAYNLQKNKLIWKKSLELKENIKVRIAGNVVFITKDENLVVLNRRNGSELKNIKINFPFELIDIVKDLAIISGTSNQSSTNEYAIAIRWK